MLYLSYLAINNVSTKRYIIFLGNVKQLTNVTNSNIDMLKQTVVSHHRHHRRVTAVFPAVLGLPFSQLPFSKWY